MSRPADHLFVWKRDLVSDIKFPDRKIKEDIHWAIAIERGRIRSEFSGPSTFIYICTTKRFTYKKCNTITIIFVSMSIRQDRKKWLVTGFNTSPNFPCPRCKSGTLTIKKDWVKIRISADSKKEPQGYLNFHPEIRIDHFAGILVCSVCYESVTVCGILRNVEERTEYSLSHRTEYRPKFFFPALPIIHIGSNCPVEIKIQIEKSFLHYFSDSSACANSLRTAFELIIIDYETKNNYHTPGNGYITLGMRINEFAQHKPELRPFFDAARWIGNAGSHPQEISKEASLDGYELLEYCLDELYEKDARLNELRAKVDTINQTKGPIQY